MDTAVGQLDPEATEVETVSAEPSQNRITRLSLVIRWLVPALALAVTLFSVSRASITAIGPYGIVSALNPPAIVGSLVLGASFFVNLGRRKLEPVLLGFHVLALATVLTLSPLLIEGATRFTTAYVHAGFADYIAQHDAVRRFTDARFSWPGFFALVAMLSRLTGLDPLALAPLASLFLVTLQLPLIFGITHNLTSGIRRPWLATWFYLVINWVGQDYFAPQGINLLFYLAVLYVITRYLKPSSAALAATRDRGSAIRRVWTSFVSREPEVVELTPGQRTAAILVVVLILAASVVSHQLTPIGLAAVMFALIFSGRLTARSLPIILTVMVSGWLCYAATDYWTGHLATIFGGIGKINASVSSNVSQRIVGAHSHLEIVHLRLLVAGLVGMGAAYGLLRSVRHLGGVTLTVLLAVPVTVVGVQDYGGEAALRVYLYSLPAAATLLAFAVFVREDTYIKTRVCLAGVVGLTLLALFPFTRYGNEAFESFSSSDVAMMRYLLSDTPDGTAIVILDPATVAPFMNIENHPTSVVEVKTHILPTPAEIAFALDAAGPDAYLYLNPSQFAALHATSSAPLDAQSILLDELRSSDMFTEVRSSGRASVWRTSTVATP